MKAVDAQVLEFHHKFGQPIGKKPHVPDEKTLRFRLSLIAEEFFELLAAAGVAMPYQDGVPYDDWIRAVIRDEPFNGGVDLPEFVDAMADLDYVVAGTRITMGVDGGAVAAVVHASNMSKVGGGTREDGKIMKPPGFKPPDIAGELKRQGWGEK